MASYRADSGILGINDRKEKENHPDYTGKIYVEKPGLYYLKGWKRQGKSGQPLLTLAADYAQEDKQEEARQSVQSFAVASAPTNVTSDEAPF
jgi:hypothetical protein